MGWMCMLVKVERLVQWMGCVWLDKVQSETSTMGGMCMLVMVERPVQWMGCVCWLR